MNTYIKIIVSRPDKVRAGQFKELYRNSVPFDDSVKFPFADVVSTLKVLYPFPDILINFMIG